MSDEKTIPTPEPNPPKAPPAAVTTTPAVPPERRSRDFSSSRDAVNLWGIWNAPRPGWRQRFPYSIMD
jgi:hypothetical protein